MKILVLSPEEHFHAPIVLRELCRLRPRDEIFVLTTPKFFKPKPLWTQVRELAGRSGWPYLFAMAWATLGFGWKAWAERVLRRRTLEQRKFLSMGEVLRHYRLPRLSFRSVNDPAAVAWIERVQPDLIFSNLFNQILRPEVLRIPRLGCINLHTSPLPAYRGMAPNFWALVNGEKSFGTTLHRMSPAIDNGTILAQKEIPVDPEDTVFSLYRRASVVGAALLPCAIRRLEAGEQGEPQDESRASYFSHITPEAFQRLRAAGKRFF